MFIFTKTMWCLRMFWLLHHTVQFSWRNWNWRLACWFSLLLLRIFAASVVKRDVICYEKLFVAECNSWMLLTSQLQGVEQSKLDVRIRNIERTRRCEKKSDLVRPILFGCLGQFCDVSLCSGSYVALQATEYNYNASICLYNALT